MDGVPELSSVMDLIRKEAWKCFRKLPRSSEWTVEDLIQEGCVHYYNAQRTYKQEKSKFTTYLTMWVQAEFATIVDREYNRKVRVDYTEETDRWEQPDRSTIEYMVEVREELSVRTREFLDCILTPPEPLQEMIKQHRETARVWKNNLKRPICQFLGISEQEFVQVRQELQSKSCLIPV